MNRFWKEIEKLSTKNEKEINRKLAIAYKKALDELRLRIGTFMAEHLELRYVDLMQLAKLESLYVQIDNASRKVIDDVKDIAYKADLKEIELGYFGEFYNIESQLGNMGANLSFGLLFHYLKDFMEILSQ